LFSGCRIDILGAESNLIAAWDWCVTHKYGDPPGSNPDNPILIINASLGLGYFTSPCDGDKEALAISAQNAAANGITIFAPSGNDGYCDGLIAPACLTDVISVGAVYDTAALTSQDWCVDGNACWCIDGDSCVSIFTLTNCLEKGKFHYCLDVTTTHDQAACYSNSVTFLDLLAPSHIARTTAIVGSGPDGEDYREMGWTSAASPYAAGAGALLQNYSQEVRGDYLTPDELRSVLRDNGDLVTDGKSGLTYPRVNALASALAMGPPPTSTTSSTTTSTSSTTTPSSTTTVPIVRGDLDCDGTLTGADVLVQASMVVNLIGWEDLPDCIPSYGEMMATCDWDCNNSIDGTDVLIGASIIVDIITEADTPLGQGCPPE
jgi:subtilisin family serine protease